MGRLTSNELLLLALEADIKKHLGAFEKEVIFNKIMKTTRRFRADYCIKNKFIIIEVNGGQFSGGRHNRGGKGYEDDLTKGNIASLNGWIYLQYTYQMLKRGEHILDFEFLAKIDLLQNPPFG